MKKIVFTALSVVLSLAMHAQTIVNLNTKQRGPKIGDLHYGIFYEEINHAGDGGLYAELIRNRSFEDSETNVDSWSSVGSAVLALETSKQLNDVQKQALRLQAKKKGDGARNNGYWGMHFVEGETYKFSMWARTLSNTANISCTLSVNLEDADGKKLTTKDIEVTFTPEWQQITTEIISTASYPNGKMSITLSRSANLLVDVVSLFPPTYKDRPNGCRRDLAKMLEDLHPRFMRFPGGCYIEGMHNEKGHNRFEWKKSIGPIEERPGHWNVNWGYRASDGLGFHELLQLSEDLGAKPLFVVNIGIGHDWQVDVDSEELNEYIQEALDAVEYCNGDTTTTWGALRAKNGHPEPFHLQLIEIGNENEWMDKYEERYKKFYKALHDKYPDLIFIADREVNATFNANDEHYYSSPSWFESQYDKYNSFDRNKKNKVYVGEYAVTQDFGTVGNLTAALGEAIFMQGMEVNSDVVMMNSYAPIFTHESDFRWRPDMIRFNSHQSYGTPSYYIQKLMPAYVGEQNITWTESNNRRITGDNYMGLSTWGTKATFRKLTITRHDDGEVYTEPFDGSQQWLGEGGTWSQSKGVLTQSDEAMQGDILYNPNFTLGENYTIELTALKKSGSEGFLIVFNYLDEKNYTWWNIGGWGNSQHAIETCVDGTKRTVATRSGQLSTGTSYKLKIEVQGEHVKCYLNNSLVHDCNLPSIAPRKVYISSQISDEAGKLYVKMVNPTGEAAPVVLNLMDKCATAGRLVQLTSANGTDQNITDNPYNVSPTEQNVLAMGQQVKVEVPAYSFNALVLDVTEAETTIEAPEGTYYLYDQDKKLFLSRGGSNGLCATLDAYGLPFELRKSGDDTYTLRYLDQEDAHLGVDAYPTSCQHHTEWKLQPMAYGQYRLYNVQLQQWMCAADTDGACSLTADEEKATVFTLLDNDLHKLFLPKTNALEQQVETWRQYDMTTHVTNPSMKTGIDGWHSTFNGSVNSSNQVIEVNEYSGAITQTIEGLAPGIYCLSWPAFYRDGGSTLCVSNAQKGYDMSTGYIFANDERLQLKAWATDRTGDDEPSTAEEASLLFSQGKYLNRVFTTVGTDGKLTMGLVQPQSLKQGWLVWGGVTLTYYAEPLDYTSYIVNPSFEEDLTTGWTNNGFVQQSNNEVNAAKTGEKYCEKHIWVGGNLGTANISQVVKSLPNGDYILSATAHSELQGSTLQCKGVYLYAGNEQVAVTSTRVYEIPVTVKTGTLNIGFKLSSTDANWATVDHFRLIKLGDQPTSEATLIMTPTQQRNDTSTTSYDLTGRKTSNMHRNILHIKDGRKYVGK